MNVISDAIEQGSANPGGVFLEDSVYGRLRWAAVSSGGEMVPTFFIGATFGLRGGTDTRNLPAGFSAAIGLIAVFCGAVNCPIAAIVLSVELFGSTELTYFAVACGISYMLSGYSGLYRSQKILYSKTKRPEFINIQAK
jgi:H+/Cl- antiporter ClcA